LFCGLPTHAGVRWGKWKLGQQNIIRAETDDSPMAQHETALQRGMLPQSRLKDKNSIKMLVHAMPSHAPHEARAPNYAASPAPNEAAAMPHRFIALSVELVATILWRHDL